MQRLGALRAMVQKRTAEGPSDAADAGTSGINVQADAVITAVIPSTKRQRAMDVLKEGSSEGSEDEEEEDEDDMLNWRAKAV